MIGIDANIIVRYITRDQEEQFNLAKEVLEVRCSDVAPGFVDVIVLCEMTFTLDRRASELESFSSL